MIELRKAGGEFTGTWARSGNNDEGFGSFDIWISTVTFFGNNCINVCRITFSKSMKICFDFVIFKSVGKILSFLLSFK